MAEQEAYRATLASEAERFRAMLEGDSRSTTLVRLFNYLLEHSDSPRAPKEIEIALAVFSKNTEFDPSQDSMVRVQMHRLRNRLDGFYAGHSGPRLDIPKGEYRIILADAAAAQEEDANVRRWTWNPIRVMALVALINLIVWTSLFVMRYGELGGNALAQAPLWRAIATSRKAPLIVAGDAYMIAQSDNGRDVNRLIMRPAIRSEADLDKYLTDRPEELRKLHDLDVHYMSANTATSLWPMVSLVSTLSIGKGIPDITPASKLSRQALNGNNIVYIGRLDELAVLRPLVFHASGFVLGDQDGTLKDRRTGKRFVALPEGFEETNKSAQNSSPAYAHDYGYIACFPGAPGKQIVIIAGVQDLALPQMVKLISDKQQLDNLAQHTRGASAFEALYEVRSLGGLKFETSFLMARPLKTDI